MRNQSGEFVLEVVEATKRFGATLAVDRISLNVRQGEVLALLGDNGAGKSTLVKALSGNLRLDAGHVRVDGQEVDIRTPADARALGIETVYQDLALFDNLSAADNFFAGREIGRGPARGWLRALSILNRREMVEDTANILTDLEVRIPIGVNGLIGMMSGGQRQAIAVARAVAFASKVVILDEPTAALGLRESRNVRKLILDLAEKGIGVILISHNLEEVMSVASRAVVLRQGRYIGEVVPTAANHESIVSMIVGATTSA